MRIIKVCALLAVVVTLAGCAHSIVISPDLSKISRSDSDPQIKQNVGYYIAEDAHAKQVTTPGGGGDKVSYLPYRDIETSFYKMLSNVYDTVTKMKSPTDAAAISKSNIGYVITPELTTNSSSPSAFTWPPTQFTVDLTCKITDPAGTLIATKKVSGHGNAEFDEFKHDHGLAAKRAAQDALLKMQNELMGVSELNASAVAIPVAATPSYTISHPAVALKVSQQDAPVQATRQDAPVPVVRQDAPVAPRQQAVEPIVVSNVTYSTPEMSSTSKAEPLGNVTLVSEDGKVAFKLGVSSNTVERMGKQRGCESKLGAAVISVNGPVEMYLMSCNDGSSYLAKCELRQCVPM
jgi:hypothetical protein